jgi:uncharacterized membrane protein YbaN (DUF454 family)
MKLIEEPKKVFFIILGSLSLGLGTLGIFLPVLPTTPFYLLTAWLYLNSSEKLYDKVMANKYFGTIVINFQKNRTIPLHIKVIAVSTLWITILLSAFVFVSTGWVQLLLIAIAMGVTIHILSYKTL